MRLVLVRSTLLAVSFISVSQMLSQNSVRNGVGAAEGTQAAAQAVSVNPAQVPRGKAFDVTVIGGPVDAKKVVIALDGRPLKTSVLPGKSITYRARIPDPTSDCVEPNSFQCTDDKASGYGPGNPVTLSEHPFSISFDDRWFPGTNSLSVVKADQTRPEITSIQPEQFTSVPGKGELEIQGKNFIVDPAQDNVIRAGSSIVAVTWDGCPEDDPLAVRTPGVHGAVPSSNLIRLCNLTLPENLKVDVQVRQGDLVSNSVTLRVLPWSPSTVIWASVGVVLAAVALVLLMASFLRKYRITKSATYGMFTILFLDPETNTYSLSKYQFYLWTLAAIFSYSYLAFSKIFIQGLSLPDVPSSLPGIIAIGAGTAIGSQIVTTVRGPKGSGQELPSLGDFVTSGGVAAPERVQMFVWTNLGVLLFCLATLHQPTWSIATLPTIGDGLMYLMGISSAGYLGGKLARKPGPVLSEISISPGAPDGSGGAEGKSPGGPAAVLPNIAQPIAAAQQTAREAQTAIATVQAASTPAGFTAAQNALLALRAGIAAATANASGLLEALSNHASDADAASQACRRGVRPHLHRLRHRSAVGQCPPARRTGATLRRRGAGPGRRNLPGDGDDTSCRCGSGPGRERYAGYPHHRDARPQPLLGRHV